MTNVREDFGEPKNSDKTMLEYLESIGEEKLSKYARAIKMTPQQLISLCCTSAGQLKSTCRINGINYYDVSDLENIVDSIVDNVRNL